jgi:hypothetical protein
VILVLVVAYQLLGGGAVLAAYQTFPHRLSAADREFFSGTLLALETLPPRRRVSIAG